MLLLLLLKSTELLTASQTSDENLIATFNFSIDLPIDEFPASDFASYTLFPSSLGKIT